MFLAHQELTGLSNQIWKGEQINADRGPWAFRCVVINVDWDPSSFYLCSNKARFSDKEF